MTTFNISASDIIAAQHQETAALKTEIANLNLALRGKQEYISDLQHIQKITDLEVDALNVELKEYHKELRKSSDLIRQLNLENAEASAMLKHVYSATLSAAQEMLDP